MKTFFIALESSVCSITAFILEALVLLNTTSTSAQNRLFAFQITLIETDI